MSRRCRGLPLAALGLLLATLAPLPALAQAATAPEPPAAPLLAGLMAVHQPRYEGARRSELVLRPLVLLERGPFFIGARAGVPAAGWQTRLGSGWRVGAFVGFDGGRSADDDPRLQGLADIDSHAVLGLHADWRQQRLGFSAAYRRAAKSGLGGALRLDGTVEAWSHGPHALNLGLGVEWADRDAMQTRFGIRTDEAQRSPHGLAVHTPSAGISRVSAGARWTWRMAPQWLALGALEARQLQGDAADSPLVQRRTAGVVSFGVMRAF